MDWGTLWPKNTYSGPLREVTFTGRNIALIFVLYLPKLFLISERWLVLKFLHQRKAQLQ